MRNMVVAFFVREPLIKMVLLVIVELESLMNFLHNMPMSEFGDIVYKEMIMGWAEPC